MKEKIKVERERKGQFGVGLQGLEGQALLSHSKGCAVEHPWKGVVGQSQGQREEPG